MAQTQLTLNNELKIPLYDAGARRILDTPLLLRHAILAHLFDPQDVCPNVHES